MTLNGLRFAHVAFRVTDVERTIQWYRDVLGAQVVCHVEAVGPKPEYYYAEFANGQMVEFFPGATSAPDSPADAPGFAHLSLQVDSIEEALAHVTAAGAELARPYFEGRAGQRVFFLADPDGHQIELMELRRDSPIWRD
jgi:lactoylglutathione lyase